VTPAHAAASDVEELLPMLKTVRDACVPHRMALDFSLAEQIEDLGAP
jgi:hypothetical protein